MFEDFSADQRLELGSHTFDAPEMIEFARQWDPQPFHIEPEAAKHSIFGGLIASGWHTNVWLMRFMVDTFISPEGSLGSPGLDEIRWPLPVRVGDTIHYDLEVLSTVRSRSKPDRGIVHQQFTGTNQHGEVVMSVKGMGMFRCRYSGSIDHVVMLDAVIAAHRQLLTLIDNLDDRTARGPSRLPGWTVGHLLSHIAGNADGQANLLEGRPQYLSMAARDDAIKAGAGRTARELVEAVTAALGRFERVAASASNAVWAGRTEHMRGLVDTAAIPFHRLRESQVHTADLGLDGFSALAWLTAYTDAEWPVTVGQLGERLPPDTTVRLVVTDSTRDTAIVGPDGLSPVEVRATKRELLAWMLGRDGAPAWPVLAPW